jgi:hypothetical protein
MRSFRFESLLLLSQEERRARAIKWSPEANALIGSNHTGKSTIIRMLYYCLGCDIRPLGPGWSRDTVIVLGFAIEDVSFRILRAGPVIGLFNGSSELIWAGTDRSEFRDVLNSLLEFTLRLTHQQGDARAARTAFFFIPSYIDQDGSWDVSWNTFKSLSEFKDWPRPTIEYFLGLRPSEYWTLVGQLSVEQASAGQLIMEQTALDRARERLQRRYPRRQWWRTGLEFRQDLKRLEERASLLSTDRNRLEREAADGAADLAVIESQIALADAAIREHSADMRFLDDWGVDEEVICPTCGTGQDASFYSRLELAGDADDLRNVREDLVRRKDNLAKQFATKETTLQKLSQQAMDLESLLEQQRGKLKLRDIVDQAGISKAYEALEGEAAILAEKQGAAQLNIAKIEERLSNLQDSERSKEITTRFSDMYIRYCTALDVPTPDRIRKHELHRKPALGGSGGPRAILAYHYALSETASHFSQSIMPPMVIDSPHAKAQDAINRPLVTEFIFRNRIPGQQLIAALEEGLPPSMKLPKGSVEINLTNKFHVMQENEYAGAFQIVQPLLRAARARVVENAETQPNLFNE